MLEITEFLREKYLMFLSIVVKTCDAEVICNCSWEVYLIIIFFPIIYFWISSEIEKKDWLQWSETKLIQKLIKLIKRFLLYLLKKVIQKSFTHFDRILGCSKNARILTNWLQRCSYYVLHTHMGLNTVSSLAFAYF